jgi:hypothetical protein
MLVRESITIHQASESAGLGLLFSELVMEQFLRD